MNIHPNVPANPVSASPGSAASLAGTSRAAARGGESDNQAIEASRQQSMADRPGGKAPDSNAVDAGDETGDRGGNGRQLLDVFEPSDDPETTPDAPPVDRGSASADGAGEHLDLQA
jgi:hypothetical protein